MKFSRRKRRPMPLERKTAYMGYVFILPLIIGIVFFLIPMLYKTCLFSVSDIVIGDGGYSLTWRGLDFYRQALFSDPSFNRLVVESLGTLVVRVPTILLFSLVMAALLNSQFKGRLLARSLFFIPILLSSGVVASVENSSDIINLINNHNTMGYSSAAQSPINELLTSIEFSPVLIDVITSAAGSISSIVQASGLQIFICLTGFQEVPQSLYEAAEVEGSSKWEQFWKITIPLVSPQIVVAAIYTLVDSYIRADGPVYEYIYNAEFYLNQYSFGTAMNILYLLCLAVFVVVAWLFSRRFVIYND